MATLISLPHLQQFFRTRKGHHARKPRRHAEPKRFFWWLTYPSEKYEFISWDDYPIYEMENNPAMFETTNQVVF